MDKLSPGSRYRFSPHRPTRAACCPGIGIGLLAGFLTPAFSSAAAQEPGPPAVFAEFMKASGRLGEAFEGFSVRHARTLSELEEVRARCLELERDTPAADQKGKRWKREWQATERSRRTIRSQIHRLIRQGHRRLESVVQASSTGPLAGDARQSVARASLGIVGAWVRLAEPQTVLQELPGRFPALAAVLGWATDSAARRSFLASVTDRLSVTPAMSDVDVLCEVVGWDELFLREQPAAESFQMLTTDLVLVFTERAADGIAVSGSALYRAGRCGDSGFHEGFRDGSDQVRHLCWALRVFARAPDPDPVEQLLRMKEARDAERRGEPLNQADLRLNHAARELVREFRNVDRNTAGTDRFRGLLRAKVTSPAPLLR